MNRKVLIVAIAVLSLILVAGVILLVTAYDPYTNNEPDVPGTSAPGDQQTPQDDLADVGDTPADPAADPTDGPEKEPTQTEPDEEDEPAQPTEEPEQTEQSTDTLIPELPTEPDTKVPESKELDYLTYHNMSGAEQAAFINTFPSIEAFFEWYNAAQKEYEDSLTEITDSTPIDAGDLTGGN